MIIYIPPIDPGGALSRRPGDRAGPALFEPVKPPSRGSRFSPGFTLVELMIAAALSALILTGILSAFLMIGRTSYNSSNYSELEAEGRGALDIFAEDARTASDIHWNGPQSITLTVPTADNTIGLATYAYDPVSSSATYGCFYRLPGAADFNGPRQILVRQVAADFSFQRFKIDQSTGVDNSAQTDLETKRIQVTLRTSRPGITGPSASHAMLSAGYVLRNKRVSN